MGSNENMTGVVGTLLHLAEESV